MTFYIFIDFVDFARLYIDSIDLYDSTDVHDSDDSMIDLIY